jgi:hypothetical protein
MQVDFGARLGQRLYPGQGDSNETCNMPEELRCNSVDSRNQEKAATLRRSLTPSACVN